MSTDKGFKYHEDGQLNASKIKKQINKLYNDKTNFAIDENLEIFLKQFAVETRSRTVAYKMFVETALQAIEQSDLAFFQDMKDKSMPSHKKRKPSPDTVMRLLWIEKCKEIFEDKEQGRVIDAQLFIGANILDTVRKERTAYLKDQQLAEKMRLLAEKKKLQNLLSKEEIKKILAMSMGKIPDDSFISQQDMIHFFDMMKSDFSSFMGHVKPEDREEILRDLQTHFVNFNNIELSSLFNQNFNMSVEDREKALQNAVTNLIQSGNTTFMNSWLLQNPDGIRTILSNIQKYAHDNNIDLEMQKASNVDAIIDNLKNELDVKLIKNFSEEVFKPGQITDIEKNNPDYKLEIEEEHTESSQRKKGKSIIRNDHTNYKKETKMHSEKETTEILCQAEKEGKAVSQTSSKTMKASGIHLNMHGEDRINTVLIFKARDFATKHVKENGSGLGMIVKTNEHGEVYSIDPTNIGYEDSSKDQEHQKNHVIVIPKDLNQPIYGYDNSGKKYYVNMTAKDYLAFRESYEMRLALKYDFIQQHSGEFDANQEHWDEHQLANAVKSTKLDHIDQMNFKDMKSKYDELQKKLIDAANVTHEKTTKDKKILADNKLNDSSQESLKNLALYYHDQIDKKCSQTKTKEEIQHAPELLLIKKVMANARHKEACSRETK